MLKLYVWTGRITFCHPVLPSTLTFKRYILMKLSGAKMRWCGIQIVGCRWSPRRHPSAQSSSSQSLAVSYHGLMDHEYASGGNFHKSSLWQPWLDCSVDIELDRVLTAKPLQRLGDRNVRLWLKIQRSLPSHCRCVTQRLLLLSGRNVIDPPEPPVECHAVDLWLHSKHAILKEKEKIQIRL